MGWWGNILRRARIRSVKEGLVQTARAEALENDAKDEAERWQDYGFACNPVDGQGLVINVGGHTVVLRMDRLAERPQLGVYEVSVWHKEGHRVTLKAGKLVQVDCDTLVINAAVGITLNTPEVHASAKLTAPTIEAADSLKIVNKEMKEHVHGGVTAGAALSGPPP